MFTGFSRLVARGRLPGECQRHYCTDWYDLIIFLNFIKDQLFCSFKQELAFNCCIFPYRKSESWPSPQGSPCLQLWRPPGRNNPVGWNHETGRTAHTWSQRSCIARAVAPLPRMSSTTNTLVSQLKRWMLESFKHRLQNVPRSEVSNIQNFNQLHFASWGESHLSNSLWLLCCEWSPCWQDHWVLFAQVVLGTVAVFLPLN